MLSSFQFQLDNFFRSFFSKCLFFPIFFFFFYFTVLSCATPVFPPLHILVFGACMFKKLNLKVWIKAEMFLYVRSFSLRLAPHLEPSSNMVALEWMDVEPLIGCKVSDYIIQHKRVEDPSEAEVYTGRKIHFWAFSFTLFAFCPHRSILCKRLRSL